MKKDELNKEFKGEVMTDDNSLGINEKDKRLWNEMTRK